MIFLLKIKFKSDKAIAGIIIPLTYLLSRYIIIPADRFVNIFFDFLSQINFIISMKAVRIARKAKLNAENSAI